jgi:hypothetical protein
VGLVELVVAGGLGWIYSKEPLDVRIVGRCRVDASHVMAWQSSCVNEECLSHCMAAAMVGAEGFHLHSSF